MANKPLKSVKFPGLGDTYTIPQVDTTLAVTGAAADSKKVGDEITELKADFTQLDGKIAATLITNTASGAIASFPDGADGVPVKDLVVGIEPVQDLHGEAYPYPAGSTANMIPDGRDTNNGYIAGRYIAKDGSAKASSGNYISEWFAVQPNTQYTYSAKTNQTVAAVCFFDSSKSYISGVNFNEDGTSKSLTVTTPSNAAYARATQVYANSLFQFEVGSTGTTIMPYSNICPISGWTGANVSRTGKNLFNTAEYILAGATKYTDTDTHPYPDSYYGNKHSFYHLHGNASEDPNATGLIGRRPFGRLTISFYKYLDNNDKVYFHYTDADAWVDAVGNITSVGYKSYTSASNRVCDGVALDTIQGSNASFAIGALQIEISPQKTDYEPFGNTYSITFPTEAGTIYGGTLDVTSGVLTVDRITKTLDENASWSFSYNSETGLAQASINNVFASEEVVNNAGTPNYCNQAVFVRSESGTVPAGKFTVRSYARNFRIGIDGITTEEAWISHVTSNPIQICMVLSPSKHVTYQLTPTEVSTLLGQNNIWADCGDVSVDYRADTKLYIEKLTAPTEDDMVANNTIPDATYFMIGNNLYLSTTTIPAGDTINPGTNCTLMNLAAALNAINA